MSQQMTAILYPVAASADEALSRPRARAAREREAAQAVGEPVAFAVELAGPAFATREAALDAYLGLVDDERSSFTPPPEERWRRLVEQAAPQAGRLKPVEPTYRNGHRWPAPAPAPKTVWRLSVSYWRIASAERPLEAPQARQARRAGQGLDAETLRAIARQPMRAVKPQQPLDIGLFETRLPENPDIVVPDE
jgi:hypothetical protein